MLPLLATLARPPAAPEARSAAPLLLALLLLRPLSPR
jgi:hypothetical protein